MADKKVDAPSPVKGNKKTIILAAAGLALVACAAGGGYLLGKSSQPAAPAAQTQAAATPAAGGGSGAATVGPMVNIDSFVINIIEEKETRYLKAAVTLEMANALAVDEVKLRMPQIRDAILLLVGNKTFSEVRDLQGKLQLRAEMLDKINSLLQSGAVLQIYFTDFVVQ
ncbi:MAG: flagellar basal body-associated FliL family protein [Trichloromonadaceae bacterium]